MRELSAEAEALWRAVEVASSGGSQNARVKVLLVQLARAAPEQSEAWVYAHRELAAHLVADDPWRASICARRAIAHTPHDAMAWGIVGLSQSVLGNHRFAVRAYRRALRYEPNNPWYAHNLGHLLDVVFDDAAAAVPLLEGALADIERWPEASPQHRVEIAASLAHALMRNDDLRGAHAHIRVVIQSGLATRCHHELYAWVRQLLEASLAREIQRLHRCPDPAGCAHDRAADGHDRAADGPEPGADEHDRAADGPEPAAGHDRAAGCGAHVSSCGAHVSGCGAHVSELCRAHVSDRRVRRRRHTVVTAACSGN